MRFRKLDEKTICCMLSEEDLTDNDITIEDFIHNRDNVQYFLEEIIETAREEVGFEASDQCCRFKLWQCIRRVL